MKSVDSITKKAKKAEQKNVEAAFEPTAKAFNFSKDLRKQKKIDKGKRKKAQKSDKKPGKKPKNISKSKKKKNAELKPIYKAVIISTVRIFFVCIILSTLLFSGAVYAYKSQYEEKVMWGTQIFGEDLGGKTEKEVQEIVKNKLIEMKLTLLVDGEEVIVTPQEVGVEFAEEEIVKDIIINGKTGSWQTSWVSSAVSILYQINPSFNENMSSLFKKVVSPKYQINEVAFEKFVAGLSEDFDKESKNAALLMKGTEVQVVPAIYGQAIIGDSIRTQIESSITENGAHDIRIDIAEIQPEIIEEEAKKSINLARELISRSIVFTYNGKQYVPAKEIIGGWVDFEENGESLIPKISASKMKVYLNNVAKGINIPSVIQKVKVINGKDEEITQAGKDGLAVDTENTANISAEKLNSGKSIQTELQTYIVKYKTSFNNVLVADWAKYIEVDISTQTMCAYLKGGEKINCWAVTTGQSNVINGISTKTPIGTFLISKKAGAGGVAGGPGGGGVCMPNPPNLPPYDKLCGINYVSTFTPQGHAIHEAWWRTATSYNAFGNPGYVWNGSHGCVNSPYEVAKFIYYWAPLGTPVVIHY